MPAVGQAVPEMILYSWVVGRLHVDLVLSPSSSAFCPHPLDPPPPALHLPISKLDDVNSFFRQLNWLQFRALFYVSYYVVFRMGGGGWWLFVCVVKHRVLKRFVLCECVWVCHCGFFFVCVCVCVCVVMYLRTCVCAYLCVSGPPPTPLLKNGGYDDITGVKKDRERAMHVQLYNCSQLLECLVFTVWNKWSNTKRKQFLEVGTCVFYQTFWGWNFVGGSEERDDSFTHHTWIR